MAKSVKKEDVKTIPLGWVPDLPDQRDFSYGAPPQIVAKLPSIVNHQSKCPPVYNQGQLGSCTANALGAAFEVGLKIQGKSQWRNSRLFLYYNSRAVRGWQLIDSGAYLRDAIKTMSTQGMCPETEWTYDDNKNPGKFSIKPPASCYQHAKTKNVLFYQAIPAGNLNAMKSCIAEGYPFVFGFTVYDSFYNITRNGLMPLPKSNEKVHGGHAVCAVGYNDAMQCFIVRNSWGTGWGANGYFYMPYAFITSANASDFWTIRLVNPLAATKKSAPKKAVKKAAK